MSNIPIRIAIAGATGRMGRKLVQAVVQSEKVELCAALTRTGSILCGIDAGELAGINAIGISISSELSVIKDNFDILIDFTHPEASMDYLAFCCQHHKGIVIGTSGFNNAQKEIIRTAAKETGVVFSANFSISVNLMFKLLEKVTKVIGKEADIEIIEAHHCQKVDAPSSTALKMGEVVASTLGCNLAHCAIYRCKGHIGKRKEKSIGFSMIRAGDIIGEHTIMFAEIGERLEITHRASSRMTFARGAVRAAIWLYGHKRGLFDMTNVLNLDKL